MQSKDSSKSHSETARNEKRDSQGRFESTDKKDSNSKSTSKVQSNSRSENAKNEKRDSHGRFEK